MKKELIIMKTAKRTYSTPTLTYIQLDNEISLQLQSPIQSPPTIDIGDPDDPDCVVKAPDYFNNKPFA